ncbi:hypothetical protein GS624_18970 [Ruegeria sp. HKCCD5849]|uniref:hypothetical protein n=1 Tax=unclassified Ruegeria TaxID=2625375 RepID=UPI00147DC26F|nr:MULTISPECIES: hypothetical protein [unclassified Ruegeria]NOD49401.1 hypothetical protein [Ruegeria sp. HKCCD5849]NOD53300.1 hypothetical protein [Ruegeria sp. HKCCD5851]
MFNLIVSGGIESERRGSISSGRVFEYTDDHLVERFKPAGRLDPSVTSLPTVLMEEGTSNEVVGIGWLTRVELRGQEYQLHFTLDPEIPRLTNADLLEMAPQLQIDDWEFSRNHWAIKDVDLFQSLFRRANSSRPAPNVFQLSNNPVVPNLVSMMMPFSGSFSQVHQTVKAAIEAEGYECRRADDFWMHPHIMQDIIELICTSRVVICDLSGKNPNVFYEAGIAHTLGKDVVLITQSMDDVPFDLRSLRCIHYLNNQEGCDALARDVVRRLETLAPI